MSECVVRMKKPRDGLCDLAFSFLDGTFCTIEGNRCNYCDDGAIPKWCPIIRQLPEGHGRLVDADALYKKRYIVEPGDILASITVVDACYISGAQTIVPAERS